ncbi:MAG: hypothetical protein J7L83_00445 [Thaumarchaeota archaeon]|nr:hypothetical protein [Nitrososphaerota archaeon]
MIILAEKLDRRDDLAEKLREWLRELLKDASEGRISVEKNSGGWMVVETDDEKLVKSIISLQTKLNPIASEKPPRLSHVAEIGKTTIKVEYPTPSGETALKELPIEPFTASLGCEENPKEFLEAAGITEGSIVSISAEAPSHAQLKLVQEYVLRGLDRILVLNAAPQEIERLLSSQWAANLIADYQVLTLSSHVLYVKLGAMPSKVLRKIREEMEKISKMITVRLLSWKILAELNTTFELRDCDA